MQVTICGPNLNDQSKGQYHVHAADCADLKKGARREPVYADGWTIEAKNRDEVGDDIYADHIDEGSMQPGEGKDDCHFFPCCAAELDKPADVTQVVVDDVVVAEVTHEDIAPAVPFDPEAYALMLDIVNNAVTAMRNAQQAAKVLLDAGEAHGIEPFKTIGKNYSLLFTDPVLRQLESEAADAANYYPVRTSKLLGKTLTGLGFVAGKVTGIDGQPGGDQIVTVVNDKGEALGFRMHTITALIATGDVGVE